MERSNKLTEHPSKWKDADVVSPLRPFTTMGSTMLHLQSTTRELLSPKSQLPSTAGALSTRNFQVAPNGEFDVRRFLLDQKTTQPLHKSSLFRTSTFTNQSASTEGIASRQESPHQSHFSKPRKFVLPRMEVSTSHSTGTLPNFRHTSWNDQLDEGNNSFGSHFYSIERMATSCFHATQNKNKTWLFLPGSDERSKSTNGANSVYKTSITGVERPSRRADLRDLEQCFDTAIQFASKKKNVDIACEETLSMLDQDFMAIYARMAEQFGSTMTDIKANDERKTLTKLLFEQKWSDVIVGELESMLTVSFLEQGVLLRKARILYAKTFFQLEQLYRSQWQELVREKEEVTCLRENARQIHERHEQDMECMKEHYEGELEKLQSAFESDKNEMERRAIESKEQMTKMGDTMKTLNAIFRQMREDTEKVKAVELRENYNILELKYKQCRDEMEQLRSVVHEKQQLISKIDDVVQDRDACKAQVANLTNLINAKDTMIASLMEQQSNLIAVQELATARDEQMRRQVQEDVEDERDVKMKEPNMVGNGQTAAALATLCARCKQDLHTTYVDRELTVDDKGEESLSRVSNESEHSKPSPKKRRIQCLYFRILLPNLNGRRPQRDAVWTLSCMRSILFAKQIDDSMCKRTAGLFPLRIRMPEFVYAWFSPWRSLKEEKAVDETCAFDGTTEREISDNPNDPKSSDYQQRQANEDRWCLYYGVRSLAQQGCLEAKLFLSLLDEKLGEDEQVFMLHCYRVLDVLVEGRMNWGPLRAKVSYELFSREFGILFASSSEKSDRSSSSRVATVPKTIWISPYHASLATSVILAKATKTERRAIDKKIFEHVVTNVPDDERPQVFLQPKMNDEDAGHELSSAQQEFKGDCRNKTVDADVVEANVQEPLQFVDANLWIELMMLEYKEEQAHRRAAIRLMFQTATTSAAAATRESAVEMPLSTILGINYASMDMDQFRVMVRTLNDEIPSFMIATLFRNAYTRGNGTVNFDSFMDAAETWQFFSTCMRLESPSAVVSRLFVQPCARFPMTSTPSSKAAHIVDNFFTILGTEISSTIQELPLWTRSMTDALAHEISSSLMEGNFSDGVRLLILFQRLIDNLGVAKLIRREITGCVFNSKDLYNIEKALSTLLEFARQREQSPAELLVDAIRQKLSVRRVQVKFRKRLLQDQGAPLVLRSLMHRRYGSGVLNYRHRRAERPVAWLHRVISLILRRSLQSEPKSALLQELSAISGVFHGGRSSPLQLAVSSSVNGGIGPTPKPVFVEIVYDFFLEKLGTRCEAERLLHDVFAHCRSLVQTDSLAMLFSHLCCITTSCPEDRILGQNEALSFLHALFRCSLHSFRLINPISEFLMENNRLQVGNAFVTSSTASQTDFVAIDVAERMLLTAFAKLRSEQKVRLKARIAEAANDNNASPLAIEASTFLVLALHEWRRYILYRLDDIRVACCEIEGELLHFQDMVHLETLSRILENAGITFTSADLCAVMRRLYLTETARAQSSDNGSGRTTPEADPMSDRIAAACFPLVAKEALNELEILDHATAERFQVNSSPLQSYEFLVDTWDDYKESCQEVLEKLWEMGKDDQVKSVNVYPLKPGSESGGSDELLYQGSSSTDKVSSQDVAQLDATRTLFVEKMRQLTKVLEISSPNSTALSNGSTSRSHDEFEMQETMVDETWKVFRQMLVSFVRLRAIARLGDGALPDRWERRSV